MFGFLGLLASEMCIYDDGHNVISIYSSHDDPGSRNIQEYIMINYTVNAYITHFLAQPDYSCIM